MKRELFLIILCGIFASSSAQDVKVSSWFDTTRIYIGDQVGFNVTIEQDTIEKLAVQTFADTIIGKIEILAGPVSDTVYAPDGKIRIKYKYLVTCFDSGYYYVPPVYAEKRNEGGIVRFYSDYAGIEVVRVRIAPSDTTSKIFDIIDPYKAPVTIGEVLPWVLIGILAAALIFIAYRLLRKFRRKGSVTSPAERADPPHVVAFRELEILRNSDLCARGEIKEYYSRLTDILRKYLENRFGVSSLEMTTGETLEALVKTGFPPDKKYELLKEVLSGADLVKFAKFIPDAVENESSFSKSWDFVDQTKPEEKAGQEAETPTAGKEGAL
jgi:hypothetical protein